MLIDVTRLLYRRVLGILPTGIDRVSLEYLRRYGPRARALLCLGPFSAPLADEDSQALFRVLIEPHRPARALAAKVLLKAFAWRWLATGAPARFLLNTGHVGLENARYAWWPRHAGARALVMIHDLIPITHPQYCRPDEHGKHQRRMRCAARIGAGLVANSQHTLEEFRAFCAQSGIPCPPAIVAHLGLGLRDCSRLASPIPEPYFVALGTLEPRKNHALLLRLWERLRASGGTSPPVLVIIGQAGWNRDLVASIRLAAERSGGTIRWLERCADEELSAWMRHARAVLFPSFVEGYGLPVGEALALGAPVIASDLAVYRETVGGIPDYADPRDEARWEALVRDYAQASSAAREAQLERLATFRPPTWEAHFERVDALLASLGAAAPASTAAAAPAVHP